MFRGAPVEIGSRAFDLLIVLLRSRGEIVSKEEIVRRVWPSTTVDESNLRFQMTVLRRVLGKDRDRIKTVPGRGYLFVDDEGFAADKVSMLFRPVDEAAAPTKTTKAAIFIIDEDPENRASLQRLLRPFDAEVECFASLAAFLESRSAAIGAGTCG
ncbi:winged helix-turn-helix domain-containing protein [Sphingomonas sp. JC676]|nr:winged helix-turn-helix domain-containing protein [Sphingomonas sp. JC676]